VILFRTHYLISKAIDLSEYEGFVYNVSTYSDINDLYILADMIITDYSSAFFDYANLKRPLLFYMYDLDDYRNNMRDFYIDLEELPGPVIRGEQELYDEIKGIGTYWDRYREKYEAFNRKFNYLDDRDSSKRVLDIVTGKKDKSEAQQF
jgi:CDP-glycerol glycerophosphotransferase